MIRVSFVFSLQTWLAETPEQKRNATTPGYMSVFMSCEYSLVNWSWSIAGLIDSCADSSAYSDGIGCGMSTPFAPFLLLMRYNDEPSSQTYFPLFLPPTPAGGAAAPMPSP